MRLQASRVSAGLITALGVAPRLGRDFAVEDETVGSTVAIVSQRLWREHFGDAGDLRSQSIVVDNRPRTVVGVMPAGFALPYDSFIRLTEPVDVYLPIALDEPEARIRRFHSLRLIGRLRSGVSLEQAQSHMDVIARQLAAAYPENDTWHLRLVPLLEKIVGGVRPVLVLLMSAVGLLLAIACANVASLLLARHTAREHELALRGALGAARTRIVRQLLVEGLVLSLAGAVAGLLLAWWTVALIKRLGPGRFPRLETISIEPYVVGFALATAVVTTLVFALAPALHASRASLAAVVGRARTATSDRSRRRGQRALVVAQLSVSFVLLSGAALLVRGFVQLVGVETGFDPTAVMLTRLPLPADRYDTAAKIDGYYAALLDRLRSSRGITAAALATAPPLTGANDTVVYRQGRAPSSPSERRFVQIRWIQGDYFGTLGIPITAGRGFDDRLDRAGAPAVAIISRQTAQEYFGDDNPIGQPLVVDLGDAITVTVVGVSGDVRAFGQASAPPPMLYFDARQRPIPFMQIVVKSAASTGDVAAIIRREVLALDPTLAPAAVERMDFLLADSVAQPKFAMLLITSFATMALGLALIGLYGTLAYLVAQRRREIGIRLAVGATGRDIRRMMLGQGGALIAVGVPVGLLLSLFTSRLAAAVFLDVRPADPLILAGVTALIATTAFAAVLVPAANAARVEAIVALRTD
jgi:putative ABC transport system permease protein